MALMLFVMLIIFMHPVVVSVMSFVIEVSLVAECSLESRAGIGIEDHISLGKRLKKNKSSYQLTIINNDREQKMK